MNKTKQLYSRLSTPLAGMLLAFFVPSVWAEQPTATPYRPTVSNPADLSEPGFFELEAGGRVA